MQGGSHPQTNVEVGNQTGIVHVQDHHHPTEMLRPEVSAMLPSFMVKQGPPFTSGGGGYNNPPPRHTQAPPRFSHHDNRFMQHSSHHPQQVRREPLVQCAIVKEEDLSKLDEVAKDGGWVLHDSVDYNQQLNFSDEETEDSENKENKMVYTDENESSSAHVEDEHKLRKLKLNEIMEKAKVRKESEEQRFIESKQNASKKLEALTRKMEEKREVEATNKDERKSVGQPVVKDGNEFRQLTQLGGDKPSPHSYKESTPSSNNNNNSNFSSSRFSVSNKPPRMRKQEEMQHKGFYNRQNQDSRNYYDNERDYERDRFREYDSRDRYKSSGRDYRGSSGNGGGGYERKFSDQRSNYRDHREEYKYQGRYSDSSDPSIDSRQRDSWERETPNKRKDSDRSKQSYEDEGDHRYRSEPPQMSQSSREKETAQWESSSGHEKHHQHHQHHHEEYDGGKWADQVDYEREEMSLWEKEKRMERPQRPDSRDSRASRDSKTSSHCDHVREENIIEDPMDEDRGDPMMVERDRKPVYNKSVPYSRGAGVPITLEKLEAAESKQQDKASVLVPLIRSDKNDYKKLDGKDDQPGGKLDAWSTPLNAKFNESKKEASPPEQLDEKSSSQVGEEKMKEKTSDETGGEGAKEKESKSGKVEKDSSSSTTKKDRMDRDGRDGQHHRNDRDRGTGSSGGGRGRYQNSRSGGGGEWSNSYRNNWSGQGRDGRDSRDQRGGDLRNDRRGHGGGSGGGRGPQSRGSYGSGGGGRHPPRSESDPDSGKEERYHDNTRERRMDNTSGGNNKPRKERGGEDLRYNDRYERKDRERDRDRDRDRYYDQRGSREYTSRGRDGGGNYRSSGRRGEYGGGGGNSSASKNNFSGDEKKSSRNEKKENTSEDDKKDKKAPPSSKSGSGGGKDRATDRNRDKEWESDGKDSLDEDSKYNKGGGGGRNASTYTRSVPSRGVRNTYSARKGGDGKFGKDQQSRSSAVKEEKREDLSGDEKKGGEDLSSSGGKGGENGFQEVKNKKTGGPSSGGSGGGKDSSASHNASNSSSSSSSLNNKKVESKSKETSTSGGGSTVPSGKQNSSSNVNTSSKSSGGVKPNVSNSSTSTGGKNVGHRSIQQQTLSVSSTSGSSGSGGSAGGKGAATEKSSKDSSGTGGSSNQQVKKSQTDHVGSSDGGFGEKDVKVHQTYSMGVKDLTGPPPPPPATNAWDRPLNASLKSSSPAPSKTQTPPPSGGNNNNISMDQHRSNANTPVDEPSSHHHLQQHAQQQHHHYQQQAQHQQQQKMEEYRSSPQLQQQQTMSEHQQQQIQAQFAQQKQHQQQMVAQQQLQQQVQQQALDKIDSSLLDGTSTSVPTIIFENTNFKPVLQQEHQYQGAKEAIVMKDYKKQDLGCGKEDNSDMKLDFTSYGTDLNSEDCKPSILPHNLHMVQSSDVELNWKIASVKRVWDETEVEQPDVNTFPPHSGSGSAHFNVSTDDAYNKRSPNVVGGGNPVTGATVDCGSEVTAAGVAADMQMYSSVVPRIQHAHVNSYATSNMNHKDPQSELQKMSKQQMQAGPVLSTPPPQSYGQAHYQTAPFSALPSITSPQAAAAAVLYSTTQLANQAFPNYPMTDAAQLMSSAATRQNTTQYPFPLSISQGLSQSFNQQPNLYIHQPTTPSPSSELANQIQGYHRIHQAATGAPTYGSSQQMSSNPPPPHNALYISSTASVKQSNPNVGAIGTKTGYQPSQPSQVFIPANLAANIYDPTLQSYLSQSTQRQAPPSGSSFYSTGGATSTGQAPAAAYYQSQAYNPGSPYGLNYGAQSPAPAGQQQMASTMTKTVVGGGKYNQPPPQQQPPPQGGQQQAQVKYSAYPTGGQPQLIQASTGAPQAGQPQQQATQVLITQATQQQTNQQ